MITSILTILAGIPGLAKLIDKWITEAQEWKVVRDNEQRRKAIESGIEKAKKTKDTSDLEGSFK